MADLSPSTSNDDTNPLSIKVVYSSSEEANRLSNECNKKAHLDGKFFEVDLANSSLQGQVIGTCKLCTPTVQIKGTLQSSTNFLQHLKRKHQKEYDDDFPKHKKLKQTEVVETGNTAGRKKNDLCKFSQSIYEDNVANYVLNSMAPLSTVEMQSFRKIFDDMNIRKNGIPLKHISRRTLERRIDKIFSDQMNNIRKELNENAVYVCTTADIWTGNTRRFLGVTAHWIDPRNFKRHSAAIACRRFSGSHTFDRIAKLLEEVHTSFGLDPNKVVATVTDNASNFTKAFKEFGVDAYTDTAVRGEIEISSETDEDSDSDARLSCTREGGMLSETGHAVPDQNDEDVSVLSGLPRHFRCASHTLNLLATMDVLKTIRAFKTLSSHFDQVMTRCQCLWKVLRSPKQRETLTNILGQCLSRPVVVRWNSLFSSLQQIYDLREKLTEVNQALSITTPLKDSNFKFIAEYLTCLRPVAETIDRLQGEKECLYGYLLPSIISLRRKLQHNEQHSNLEYCQTIAFDLIQNIEKRFHDFFEIEGNGRFAAIAAVLQPQFKVRWVKCLSSTAQARVKEAVMEAAKKASERLQTRQSNDDEPPRVVSFDYDFGENDEIVSSDNSTLQESQIELTMRIFMSDPCCADMSAIDKYPELKDLFLQYNTPLPSSAPVERLFS